MSLWSNPGVRRTVAITALALTLPLAACGTGTDPRQPASSAPSESSASAQPTDDPAATPDPTGRWSSPETGEPFLEFSEDGSLKGSDGCNAIRTQWKSDGETILIESFMTTQKACAGVDTWLSKATSVSIQGNVMKVMDSNNKVIGGLEKENT